MRKKWLLNFLVRSDDRWCTLNTLGVSNTEHYNHVGSQVGNHLVNVSTVFLAFLYVRCSEVALKCSPNIYLVCCRVYHIKNKQKIQEVYDGCLLISVTFMVSVALCGLFNHYRMTEILLMNCRTVGQMSYFLPLTPLTGLKAARTDDQNFSRAWIMHFRIVTFFLMLLSHGWHFWF